VIDTIKTRVEAACNATVSCADILALAARDGVVLVSFFYQIFCFLSSNTTPFSFFFFLFFFWGFELSKFNSQHRLIKESELYTQIRSRLTIYTNACTQRGGPSWTVPLGRRDARTASQSAANSQIPSPASSLATLISMFSAKGLSAGDMTALSGGHTIGFARCTTFRNRIYNDTNIDASFATTRRASCPASGGDATLAPLDGTQTRFDNNYYTNLVARRGLLHSDQELFNGGSQDALVRTYSTNGATFARDFAAAMVKMGNISPLTGRNGEIRRNCRVVN
jgi:hypothetical protein